MFSIPCVIRRDRAAFAHGIWFRLLNPLLADLAETKNSPNACMFPQTAESEVAVQLHAWRN
jgi:hypothetical protein